MKSSDMAAELGLEPGVMIAKKYRVVEMIAVGGMGVVLKAHHEVLDQAVAIKVIKPELAEQAEASQRFLREARAAAKIRSECVARVTDVDLLANGAPYMVMEYLDGLDLADVIAGDGVIRLRDAVDYVLQALEGLDAAHALGIVHRDLKPSNLFLTKTFRGHPRVKVLDFGISKILDTAGSEGLLAGAVTSTQSLLGTPRYMSPEQISSSRDVDHRTDLWAVGLILYELLTKHYPFDGENAGEVLAAILTATVADIRDLRPEVPAALATAIRRSLEKDRNDRFEDARSFMRAIAPFASRRIQAAVLEAEELSGAMAVTEFQGTPNSARAADTFTEDDTLLVTAANGNIVDADAAVVPSIPMPADDGTVRDAAVAVPNIPATTRSAVWLAALGAILVAFAAIGWMLARMSSPQAADRHTIESATAASGEVSQPTASASTLVAVPSTAIPAATPANAPSASAAAPATASALAPAPTVTTVRPPPSRPAAPAPTARPTHPPFDPALDERD